MSRTVEYSFDGRYDRGERDIIVAEAAIALRERGDLSLDDEIVNVTVRGATNWYDGPVEVTIE